MPNKIITRHLFNISLKLRSEDERFCDVSSGDRSYRISRHGTKLEFDEDETVSVTVGKGKADCLPFAFKSKAKNPSSQPAWIKVEHVRENRYEVIHRLIEDEPAPNSFNVSSDGVDFDAAADALVQECRDEEFNDVVKGPIPQTATPKKKQTGNIDTPPTSGVSESLNE